MAGELTVSFVLPAFMATRAFSCVQHTVLCTLMAQYIMILRVGGRDRHTGIDIPTGCIPSTAVLTPVPE